MPEETERAVEALYEAVLAPETWPAALESLSRSLDCSGAVLVPFSSDRLEYDYRPSPDFNEAIEAYVRDGWMYQDVRADRGFRRRKQGVVLEQEISTEEERARHPYYQEWLRPHGLLWWAAICFEIKDYPWAVSFQRAIRQGPFLPQDAGRLQGLAPHFKNIVTLAEGVARIRDETGLGLIDQLGRPAFLIDSSGRVISMSRTAESVLGGDLVLRNNRLFATAPNAAVLEALIMAACARKGAARDNRDDVAVLKRAGRPPLLVEAVPLLGSLHDIVRSACALLIVTDPATRPRPSEHVSREAFGLTKAEGRLASRLATGESLGMAADSLHITYETARTELKRVFAKVGVSKQSELVALLSRLPKRG